MHNPESVPQNETQKVTCDFDIQTDYLFSTGRPDLVIVNTQKKKKKKEKRKLPNSGKLKESEKRDKYLDLVREPKNYGT